MLASIMTVTMALVPTVQASDITVKVNGEEIHPEMAPVIVEERTLVPLRAVSEALGCDVSWDADTKGITLCDGSNLYFTWIDKDHAFKTSATALEDTTVMDVPPTIMNDYTMVPLRAISEMFGATVNWDGGTSTVTIDYTKKNVEEGLAKKFETYEKVLNQKYDAYKNYNRVRYFLSEFFNYSDFIFFTQNKNHSLLYDTIPYGSDLIQRTIYAKSYLITIVLMI